MTREVYECDRCGACCKHLIIEIGYLDVLREPRLRLAAEPFRVDPAHAVLVGEGGAPIADPDPYMAGAMLACGAKHPCALLGADNHCSIYPTRPNVCVGMQAGDEQCQLSRGMAGLPPLLPDVKDAPCVARAEDVPHDPCHPAMPYYPWGPLERSEA